MPESRRSRWWLLGVAVVLAASAAAVLSPLLASRAAWNERQALADMVLAGKLAPDAAGIVALPPQFRGATADGKLYVTRPAGGGTWVLFVTWRGKGSNLRGYLYTRPPEFFDCGSGPTAEVVAPSVPPAGLSAKVEVDVEEQVRPGWYRVSYSRD